MAAGLQCGHDPKAVENRTHRATKTTYNIALQCGHDPKAVERTEARKSAQGQRPVQTSNAATTRRPWRTAYEPCPATRRLKRLHAATTRRPWRTELSVAAMPWSAIRFNAATTRRPWRTYNAAPKTAKTLWLQCGHDPKAVENVPGDGAGRRSRNRLQCGHDPKAVENIFRTAVLSLPPEASMRPRPEGRGELGRRFSVSRTTVAASMRPRPEGRGEPNQCWRRSSGGRSFNAATTRRPWRTILFHPALPSPRSLQCGHDPKAVENGPADSGSRAAVPASMRPRPEGRGEPPPRPGGRSAAAGFNAATTRRPWRTYRSRRHPGRWPGCFNAATTRRPWRTGRSERAADPGAMLQCGHDPKAVENGTSSGGAKKYRIMLQCGHDPKAVENLRRRRDRPQAHRASMRPRPEGRGEHAGDHQPHRPGATGTSMRPRPEGRGERRGACHYISYAAIASMRPRPEGRGERRAPHGLLRRRVELRMRPRPEGRGEQRRRKNSGRTDRSFNAATTRRPWRTDWQTPVGTMNRTLQCGHDPKAVEND